MIIEIEIPDVLPEGHGASFKKGMAESLLMSARTILDYTPNGHERSRKKGREAGSLLASKIAIIVKNHKSDATEPSQDKKCTN